jgi:hypothetical protein
MSWSDSVSQLQGKMNEYGKTAEDIMLNGDPVNNLEDAQNYTIAMGRQTTAAQIVSGSVAMILAAIKQISQHLQ